MQAVLVRIKVIVIMHLNIQPGFKQRVTKVHIWMASCSTVNIFVFFEKGLMAVSTRHFSLNCLHTNENKIKTPFKILTKI